MFDSRDIGRRSGRSLDMVGFRNQTPGAGHGCLVIEDLEAQAQMVLAEIDVLRRKVGLREAELAAAEVALRQLGYQGAMTR